MSRDMSHAAQHLLSKIRQSNNRKTYVVKNRRNEAFLQ